MNRSVDIISVPCGLGGPDPGTTEGPEALAGWGMLAAPERAGHALHKRQQIPVPASTRLAGLATLCAELAAAVRESVASGRFPLVLGGDHSIAVGTWRGAALAVGELGLLWFDAHLDAHTPADSPSGNPHGMPLAMLLGEGYPELAHRVLAPSRVCVIGARSWEAAEKERLARLGVRVFDKAAIEEIGPNAVMTQALSILGAKRFGISFDLDFFTPAEAPGVSTPAPGGVPAGDWLECLRGLAATKACVGLEIVEYDPARDVGGLTAKLAVGLVETLLRT